MRAAMYYSNSDIRIAELSKPEITKDEVLVKIRACGICGSDVMEWYRKKTAPRVLGHEVAGEIAKVGDRVEKFAEGQRVFVTHHVPCNTCHYCLIGHHSACDTLRTTNFHPGGFAEYLRVPEINVDRGTYLLPDNVSYEEGTFIEPLGCVYRGQRLAGFSSGRTVLVLGSGISGILHMALAKAMGAGKIIATDISPFRLEMAKKFGADVTLDAQEDVPSAVKDENEGRGADLVITSTGAKPALKQAMDSVGRGGTILWFAPTDPDYLPPIDLNRLWKDEVSMKTSYAACPEDIISVIEMLAEKRVPVKEMITHRLRLEEITEGFRLVSQAEDSLKVVVFPHKKEGSQE
ncbi:MAG: zinc-dependent dehydrogenase [Candidatus Thermoplasmatota archaeon]|nr:zinc-dependent dehydrogenase [Candidatus Thermoplasmatota archaeon]